MQPLEVVLITGAFTLVGIVLSWLLARRDKKEATKTPLPPSTQEIWQRQDKLERVMRAALVLLGEVAEQWDGEPPPRLTKRHLKILADEGYLPPEWDHLVQINQGEKE